MAHPMARLTPFGRRLLVDRIEVFGWPVAHAASRWVSPGRRPISGCVGGVLKARQVWSTCLPVRIIVPPDSQRSRNRLWWLTGSPNARAPYLMAGRLGMPRSTIYAVLKRRGLSRLRDLDRSPVSDPLCEGLPG
jgi:hypothetical protein